MWFAKYCFFEHPPQETEGCCCWRSLHARWMVCFDDLWVIFSMSFNVHIQQRQKQVPLKQINKVETGEGLKRSVHLSPWERTARIPDRGHPEHLMQYKLTDVSWSMRGALLSIADDSHSGQIGWYCCCTESRFMSTSHLFYAKTISVFLFPSTYLQCEPGGTLFSCQGHIPNMLRGHIHSMGMENQSFTVRRWKVVMASAAQTNGICYTANWNTALILNPKCNTCICMPVCMYLSVCL